MLRLARFALFSFAACAPEHAATPEGDECASARSAITTCGGDTSALVDDCDGADLAALVEAACSGKADFLGDYSVDDGQPCTSDWSCGWGSSTAVCKPHVVGIADGGPPSGVATLCIPREHAGLCDESPDCPSDHYCGPLDPAYRELAAGHGTCRLRVECDRSTPCPAGHTCRRQPLGHAYCVLDESAVQETPVPPPPAGGYSGPEPRGTACRDCAGYYCASDQVCTMDFFEAPLEDGDMGCADWREAPRECDD